MLGALHCSVPRQCDHDDKIMNSTRQTNGRRATLAYVIRAEKMFCIMNHLSTILFIVADAYFMEVPYD